MDDALRDELAKAVGRLHGVRPTVGGDICRAYRVRTSSTHLFVKTRADAPDTMFMAEADGLDRIRKVTRARIPQVIAVSPRFLALEFIERGAPIPGSEARLGQAIAELHRASESAFGLDRGGFIGPLPQPNEPTQDFAEFYWSQRIQPMAQLASLPDDLRRAVLALENRLPELLGAPEPPALLHGDLWGGNAMFDTHGLPVLYDPAVYYGHREIDLAMMQIFGGFGPKVWAGYDAVYPRAAGWQGRVPLFQLYPLLVHCALFGATYFPQLADTLRSC